MKRSELREARKGPFVRRIERQRVESVCQRRARWNSAKRKKSTEELRLETRVPTVLVVNAVGPGKFVRQLCAKLADANDDRWQMVREVQLRHGCPFRVPRPSGR